MKIALINPKHSYNTDKSNSPYHHVGGIGCIEAVLRDRYDVKVIDYQNSDKEPSVNDIADCDVVGMTSYLDFFRHEKFINDIGRGKILIVGGPFISSYGNNVSNLLMCMLPINFGVVGEGERTIVDLLECIEKKKSSDDYPGGVIYRTRQAGIGCSTKRPAIVENLDDIPMTDYSKWGDFVKNAEGKALELMLSRGCIEHCSFCYKLSPPGIRTYLMSRIKQEIEAAGALKPRTVWIADDVLTWNKRWMTEIADAFAENHLPYCGNTRIDMVDEELLRHLKKTGCINLRYGIESFNDAVLKQNNKNADKQTAFRALGMARDAGLDIIGFFIVGLPGETRESLDETIKAIKDVGVKPIARLLLPLPGTEIYREACSRRLIDEEKLARDFATHWDAKTGDHLLVNMTSLSDQELLEARDRMWQIREEMEKDEVKS